MKTAIINARRALAAATAALLCALPVTAFAQTVSTFPPIPVASSSESASTDSSSSQGSISGSSSEVSATGSASSSHSASSSRPSSTSSQRATGLPVTGAGNGPLKLAGAAVSGVALILCAAVVFRHKKKD